MKDVQCTVLYCDIQDNLLHVCLIPHVLHQSDSRMILKVIFYQFQFSVEENYKVQELALSKCVDWKP